MADITHNARLSPFVYGSSYSESVRPVQSYAQEIDGEPQVWLDLNGPELSAPLSFNVRDARRVVRLLNAAIADTNH